MPNLGMLNVNTTCEARNCFPRLLITRNMSLNSLACLGRSRLLFLTLRLFLEQLRQQTRHIIPRAGWRGIFFIALCTHLPENSFAVAKMERRPLFSTRTQFLTRKKNITILPCLYVISVLEEFLRQMPSYACQKFPFKIVASLCNPVDHSV